MKKIVFTLFLAAVCSGIAVSAQGAKTIKGKIWMEFFRDDRFLLSVDDDREDEEYFFDKKTIWISIDGKKKGDVNLLYKYSSQGGFEFDVRVTYVDKGTYVEDGKKKKKRVALKVRILKMKTGGGGM